MSSALSKIKRYAVFTVAALSFWALSGSAARAEVVKETSWALETDCSQDKLPVYIWKEPGVQPRGIAIAIHGLVMHGGTFNSLAQKLASDGFIVYAPDLRGYGRWMLSSGGEVSEVCYDKSFDDLSGLVKELEAKHPNLPLFCVGESLGAGMAMRLAAKHPESIDGIVLSSPALKRKLVYMHPRVVSDSIQMVTNPGRLIDIVPYMKALASDDPRVTEEAANDPLVRKKLTVSDLWHTSQYIKGNMQFASQIPPEMPVLIIQGDNDRMLRWNAVSLLISKLKSTDQTIKWFKGRGHVLLETSYLLPETVTTIHDWLKDHVQGGPLAVVEDEGAGKN